MNTIKPIALRLNTGQDLKEELDHLAQVHKLEAACVLTCTGGLTHAVIRHAGGKSTADLAGPLEIVSLTGLLSVHGSHYHISVSDNECHTYGGHLLEGCKIGTTCELVISSLPGLSFQRKSHPETGYPLLDIKDIQL